MQISNIPSKIAAIFAATAAPTSKNTIPLTQAGIDKPGQASFDVGFPAITMQPAASGGINPYGQDFNGLAYAMTGPLQWLCAGGAFPFDSTFASTIGGYPKGALLQSAAGDGYWLNLTDNNSANPDTGGANWVPLDGYGITSVSGLTNANVTLSAVQYAKKVIVLSGTLTGNVQIIFPVTTQQWLVVNNTTGAFTVTCKTAAGTGSAVIQGGLQMFWGDGTNLNQGPGDSRYVATGGIVTASSDPTFANSSASPASTNWVRGAMLAIATAAGFVASFGANGYVKFPSWLGSLVIQWGQVSFTAGTTASTAPVTFPLVFPTALRAVSLVTNNFWPSYSGGTTTGFTAINSRETGGAVTVANGYWVAVGN